MENLKNLSAAQINKIINESKAELARRKSIDAANIEIRSILKKYKIGFQDIDLNIVTRNAGKSIKRKRAKVTKSRDQRSVVKAKYKDPNSSATWTGRGRTPAWVQGICQNEGILIDEFKKDDRFRC